MICKPRPRGTGTFRFNFKVVGNPPGHLKGVLESLVFPAPRGHQKGMLESLVFPAPLGQFLGRPLSLPLEWASSLLQVRQISFKNRGKCSQIFQEGLLGTLWPTGHRAGIKEPQRR